MPTASPLDGPDGARRIRRRRVLTRYARVLRAEMARGGLSCRDAFRLLQHAEARMAHR